MQPSEEFFAESREQSRIKSRIVAKYFWAWAKVILARVPGAQKRIAYVDLFAGPGRYEDGTPSTPVLVLERAIAEPDFRQALVTVFNDKTPAFAHSLKEVIRSISGIERLRYEPRVEGEEIGQKIAEGFQKTRLVPTLLFADPWGYKGLYLALIASVLRNWGSECIFFFNYNRVNPGLNNQIVREHMNDLFGEPRADALRKRLSGLRPEERENLIIEELSQALKQLGATYVLPFTFKNSEGTRTKHHLIFATKNFKGYEIMKEIMAKESSEQDQGVGSFEYSPASAKYPTLFELTRPLDDLEEMLLAEFAGQTLTMQRIYERHSVGRPYLKTNYKRALTNMEARGQVKVKPPAESRMKRSGEPTFADNVLVAFPVGTKK